MTYSNSGCADVLGLGVRIARRDAQHGETTCALNFCLYAPAPGFAHCSVTHMPRDTNIRAAAADAQPPTPAPNPTGSKVIQFVPIELSPQRRGRSRNIHRDVLGHLVWR